MARKSVPQPTTEISMTEDDFCDTSEHADAAMYALQKAEAINRLLNAANRDASVSPASMIASGVAADFIEQARRHLIALPQLTEAARHG